MATAGRQGRAGVVVSDGGGGASCRADLLLGGTGERVSGHVEPDSGDVAVTEHLHRLVGAHRTGRDQVVDADGATVREQGDELTDIDYLELDAEAVLEAFQL